LSCGVGSFFPLLFSSRWLLTAGPESYPNSHFVLFSSPVTPSAMRSPFCLPSFVSSACPPFDPVESVCKTLIPSVFPPSHFRLPFVGRDPLLPRDNEIRELLLFRLVGALVDRHVAFVSINFSCSPLIASFLFCNPPRPMIRIYIAFSTFCPTWSSFFPPVQAE